MPKIQINKLVRSKIVDLQEQDNIGVMSRSLSGGEHIIALIQKIAEEAREAEQVFTKNPLNRQALISEFADAYQAFQDVMQVAGISLDEVIACAIEKVAAKGDFLAGDFIETLDVPENSKWVEYYRERADRHPEVAE